MLQNILSFTMKADTILFSLMVSLASGAAIAQESGYDLKSVAEADAHLVNATVGYATNGDGATWSKSGGMALVAYSIHSGGDKVKEIVKGCHSWAQGGGPDASSQCLGEGFQMLAELAGVYFVAKGGEYAAVYVTQAKVVQNLLQTLPGAKRSCLGQYSDLGKKEVSFDTGAIKMTCQATPCDPLHDEERQDIRNLMYQAGKKMGEDGISQVELTFARVKGPEAVLHCKAVLGDGAPDACPNDLTLHGCNR